MRGSRPQKRQKQPKNHPTSQKIPKIIYIYLYFYGRALASCPARPRRDRTRPGRPYPKKTHASHDAKHLLGGRRSPKTR